MSLSENRIEQLKAFFIKEGCINEDIILLAKLIKTSVNLGSIKTDLDRANISTNEVLLLAESIQTNLS